MRPLDIISGAELAEVSRILPSGALQLIEMLAPDSLGTEKRNETLAQLISIETAIDDPVRRATLFGLLPSKKKLELAERLGRPIESSDECNETLSPKERRAALGFFGVALGPEKVVPQDPSRGQVTPNHGLFPHQKQVASEVEQFLYRETGRVMLHLPTGVGKTRTAMSVVATHLRERSEGLVVWLAEGRELLDQAADEFEDTWSNVGDREVGCLRFWSNQSPPIDSIQDGVVFAGLAKLNSWAKTRSRIWSLGDRTSLVLFDEAHRAVAATYKDLIETLVTRNPRTGLLGLSATPGRTWNDIDEDRAVADLFHGNKVTLRFGDRNPVRQLTDDGYLSAATFSQLEFVPQQHLPDWVQASLEDSVEIPESVAEALAEDLDRNAMIIESALSLCQRHERILVFAGSVRNATLIASVLRAMGVAANAVTGAMESGERARALAKFKRIGGPPQVLTNFGVLTTGFDAPLASAALIGRPTKSLVLYSQMVGRVIRGPRAGGTPNCEIVTVVDTSLPGFGDVADAFTNWEDIWTN